MLLRLGKTLSVSIVAAIVPTYIFWLIGGFLGVIFSIIGFLLTVCLSLSFNGVEHVLVLKIRSSSSLVHYLPEASLVIVNVFLLFSLFLIQVQTELSLVFAILNSSFLIGYCVVNLFAFSKHLCMLEKVIFSSVFGYVTTSALVYILHYTLRIGSWLIILLGTYTVLGVIALLIKYKRNERPKPSANYRRISFDVRHVVFLLILAIFVTAIVSLSPLYQDPGWDINLHYNDARVLMRYPDYYRGFNYMFHHLFIGTIYALVEPPLIVFQTGLAFLNFMMIATFYLLAKAYLNNIDKRLPMVATLFFSIFADFAGLYYAVLRISLGDASKAMMYHLVDQSTYLGASYLRGAIFPIYGFSSPTFAWISSLILLYLLKKENLNAKATVIISSIAILASFNSNTAVAVVFSCFFPIYYLLTRDSKTKPILYANILALTLTFLIRAPFFLHQYVYWNLSNILALAVPLILTLASLLFPVKNDFLFLLTNRIKKYSRQIVLLVLFLWLLSLLVFTNQVNVFNTSYVLRTLEVPWFFYAEFQGISGLFAIIASYLYLKNPEKYKAFGIFIILWLFLFIAGRAISYVNINLFNTGYREATLAQQFLVVPTSVLGGLGFYSLLKSNKKVKHGFKKLTFVTLIAGLIIIYGISSALVVIDNRSAQAHNFSMSDSELEALAFLDATFNENPDSRVFAPTSISHSNLRLAAPSERIIMTNIVVSSKYPDIVWRSLSQNTFIHKNYLYLHERDIDYLTKLGSTYVVSHLLTNINPLFENSEVKIYSLPSNIIFSPLLNSDTALIIPFDVVGMEYLYAYDVVAQSNIPYTPFLDIDQNFLSEENVILSYDPYMENKINIEIYDDFSNSSKLNNWAPLTFQNLAEAKVEWSIINGSLLPEQFPNQGVAVARTLANEFTAEFKVTPMNCAEYGYFGLFYGYEDPNNYYSAIIAWINNQKIKVLFDKVDNGTLYPFPGPQYAPTNVDAIFGQEYIIKVEIINSTHNLYLNGEKIIEWKETTPSGTVGLFTRLFTDLRFDEFSFTGYNKFKGTSGDVYLSYVEDGGRLIILNTNGYGFFANYLAPPQEETVYATHLTGHTTVDLPEISVNLLDTNYEVLRWYIGMNGEKIPFTIYTRWGDGEIYYVNIYPIVAYVEEYGKNSGNVFETLKTVLNMSGNIPSLSKVMDYNVATATKTEAIFRSVSLNGDIIVESPSFVLPITNGYEIILENGTSIPLSGDISIATKTNSRIYLDNVNIEYGRGMYAKIESRSSNVTVAFGGSGEFVLMDLDEGTVKTVMTGKISFNTSRQDNNPLEFYVKTPTITSNGEASFKEFWAASSALYLKLSASGEDITINGKTIFSLSFSDVYTISDSFTYSGALTKASATVEWNEWETLPSTIIYVTIIVPAFIVFYWVIAKNGRKEEYE